MKKLVEIHSEKPVMLMCHICDSSTQPVTKWYRYGWYDEDLCVFQTREALECCKDKGIVVDWEEYLPKDYR